jgi:hypothetical protein
VARDREDCIGGIDWTGLGSEEMPESIGWIGVSVVGRPVLRTADTDAEAGAVAGGWPA